MPPVVIDNPILNSPYREPAQHFRFDSSGELGHDHDLKNLPADMAIGLAIR